jgi:hypothetical protein
MNYPIESSPNDQIQPKPFPLIKRTIIYISSHIEFPLRLRNQRHFGQTETDGTPFTGESMKHKFNWGASMNEAELVLKGEYNDEEISDITRLFLEQYDKSNRS